MDAEEEKKSGLGMRVLSALLPLLVVGLTMQRTYTRLVERQTLEGLRAQYALVVEARAHRSDASDPAAAREHARVEQEAVARYEALVRGKAGRKVCGPRDAPCRLPR